MIETVTISCNFQHFIKWPRDLKRVRNSAFGRGEPPTAPRRGCWIARAELGRKLVGYAISYHIADESEQGCLDEVAVDEIHQHNGYGTLLAAAAIEPLREAGIRQITGLSIHPGMDRIFVTLGFADNYYHSHGYSLRLRPRATPTPSMAASGGRQTTTT